MQIVNADMTNHSQLKAWVHEWADLMQPDTIHWCDGSEAERDQLNQQLVDGGTFVRLNESKRPNSFLCCSDPRDVARVEDRTYIACEKEEDAGPTNNWTDPKELKATMRDLYKGCMKGRTMYVIPFSMGPLGSNIAKLGIELTDSAYVVVNMRIMTRMGKKVLELLGTDGEYIPCVHTVGAPLADGQQDVPWPCNETKYISHFPETNEIWSFGSGYGGNALLGKKCLALRIASTMAKREGWMAEHMLILRLTNPAGKHYYVAGAFPSACGKTNLAMLVPTLPGWKVECIGDDIAWMRIGDDGRLYAINPEAGFFGVAPGTNDYSNYNAMRSLESNAVFTNCALTKDGDVWWEEMTEETPEIEYNWTRQSPWPGDLDLNDNKNKAAHPNARYTAVAAQCPVIAPEWEDPKGVPIDAFLFGGRRATTVPLVHEAKNWDHGVFMGSICASEKTAAATGGLGQMRRDPFAMLPFCGYNMADYWSHWVDMGKKFGDKAPKIFYVNWFRKNDAGKFIWPGFGENSRVLAWICERCDGVGAADETPIGAVPTKDALDLNGLNIGDAEMEELLKVDPEQWLSEMPDVKEYYAQFGDKVPAALNEQVAQLESRLSAAKV